MIQEYLPWDQGSPHIFESWCTAIFGGRYAKNQIEYCHQVALSYQPHSNNEGIYQSIGGISKGSLHVF